MTKCKKGSIGYFAQKIGKKVSSRKRRSAPESKIERDSVFGGRGHVGEEYRRELKERIRSI